MFSTYANTEIAGRSEQKMKLADGYRTEVVNGTGVTQKRLGWRCVEISIEIDPGSDRKSSQTINESNPMLTLRYPIGESDCPRPWR